MYKSQEGWNLGKNCFGGLMRRMHMECWNCHIKTGNWLSTLLQNKLEIRDTKLQRKTENFQYVSW